jgi:hypothetical protein
MNDIEKELETLFKILNKNNIHMFNIGDIRFTWLYYDKLQLYHIISVYNKSMDENKYRYLNDVYVYICNQLYKYDKNKQYWIDLIRKQSVEII